MEDEIVQLYRVAAVQLTLLIANIELHDLVVRLGDIGLKKSLATSAAKREKR
jgi:hypothetical protein